MTEAKPKANPQTVRQLDNEIGRVGRYFIRLDLLDERSCREVLRLLRDLDEAKQAAVRRARAGSPWRSPSGC